MSGTKRMNRVGKRNTHLRVERSRESNIALQRLGAIFRVDCLALEPMHVDDMPCNVLVHHRIAFIENHKEQVEAAHDGRAHADIRLQACLSIISPSNGVRRCENGRTRVQRGVDPRFGDGYGLLLHRFVDRDLVGDVHFVELVDSANPVVGEHERPGLDGEFAGLFVFHDRGGETGS